MADKLTSRIQSAKSQLEKARQTESELKGRRAALMERLHEDFGLDSAEAAEKAVDSMTDEISDLSEQCQDLIAEVESAVADMEGK